MAFWAVFRSFEPVFCILLGSRCWYLDAWETVSPPEIRGAGGGVTGLSICAIYGGTE